MRLSLALGEALYPHPQWAALTRQWQALYPTDGLTASKQKLIQQLVDLLPRFAQLVLNHRSQALRDQRLADLFPVQERQPARLQALFREWQQQPALREAAAPSLVFAVIGQARADGQLSPPQESDLLARLLTRWALNRARRYGQTPAPRRVAAPSHSLTT